MVAVAGVSTPPVLGAAEPTSLAKRTEPPRGVDIFQVSCVACSRALHRVYVEETARIRARRETPEGRAPHSFVRAYWAYPNGHPRCAVCGEEEPISGACAGYRGVEKFDPKFEPPGGPLPTLKLPDPVFTIDRLRGGGAAGFCSRIERKERVDRAQYLVGELATAGSPARVWGVVVQRASRRFDGLESVPMEIRSGLDRFTLAEFARVQPLFYVPLELVQVFTPPVELREAVPGRRFGPMIDLTAPDAEAAVLTEKDAADLGAAAFEELKARVRSLVGRVSALSDKDLDAQHRALHALHRRHFAGTDLTSLDGLTLEDVVNAEVAMREEIGRRGLPRNEPDDGLSRALRAFRAAIQHEELERGKEETAHPPTLPVRPGTAGEHPEVTRDEVVGYLRDGAILRSPAVYLVGSLCTQGATRGDIDVLLRGPIDDSLRRAIGFRLGRALPPELSRRLHLLDGDDLGGPITDHVALYDLALVPSQDRTRKRMEEDELLLEQHEELAEDFAKARGPEGEAQTRQPDQIPHLILPPRERPRPAVLQLHVRGASIHYDFRILIENFLVGWTLAAQKTGTVAAPTTMEEARKIATAFDAEGAAYNKSLVAPHRLYAAPKAVQNAAWLKISAARFEPGEVGATRNEAGWMVEIARPKVSFGLMHPYAAEYFLEGDAKFQGLLFLRLLAGRRGEPAAEIEAGRRSREGETFWTAMLTRSLVPSVLKPRAVETGTVPPAGYSALPPGLREVVPANRRYWLAEGEAERKELRDALVRERFFTDENVRLVGGRFRRTVTKTLIEVRRDPVWLSAVGEANPHDATLRWEPIPARSDRRPAAWCVAFASEDGIVVETIPAADEVQARAQGAARLRRSTRASRAYLAEPWGRHPAGGAVWRVTARLDLEEVVDAGPLDKQLRQIPFALAHQAYRGQIVIRAAPSREVYHLLLQRGEKLVEDFQSPTHPFVADRAGLVRRELRAEARALLTFEGETPPGAKIAGALLNPTKNTPAIWSRTETGIVEIEEEPGRRKLRFREGPWAGDYTLREETRGAPFWILERDRGPEEKLEEDAACAAEPQHPLCLESRPGDSASPSGGSASPSCTHKAESFETIALASGRKLDEVQIWNPERVSDGDDRGRDRDRLRPLALFAPMKASARHTFRSGEEDRIFDDFASDEILANGILVEPKWNGFRVMVERDERNRILVFGDDVFRADRGPLIDFAQNWPRVRREIEEKFPPGPFVLDGEAMAVRDGEFVPRRELASLRGSREVDDEGLRIYLFDAIYLPRDGNLASRPQQDRRAALEWFLAGRERTHLVGRSFTLELTPARTVRSRDELLRALRQMRRTPGSEGAMLKSLTATYSLGGENDLWAKYKASRTINEIVVGRHEVENSPGVFNLKGAVGPVAEDIAKHFAETVEVGGKTYVPIGSTFNVKLDAKVGDVVEVEATEFFFDKRRDGKWRLRHFTPSVVGPAVGGVSTLNDLEAILEENEVAEPVDKTAEDPGGDRLSFEAIRARPVRLCKVEGQPEEQFVLGIVLEPETVDTQGDIYSAAEVRQAAHRFMQEHRHIGLLHRQLVDDRVRILESYVAPSDFEVDGQKVKQGSWILGARVLDAELWRRVKSGELGGWSIGGSSVWHAEPPPSV